MICRLDQDEIFPKFVRGQGTENENISLSFSLSLGLLDHALKWGHLEASSYLSKIPDPYREAKLFLYFSIT